MSGSRKCPECGSERLVPDARILDRSRNWNQDLTVEVESEPNAILLKGRVRGVLRATICGDCGHAELRATDPAPLYRAWRNATKDR